jgi:membrane protease YdiL (CAAX protease family)
VHEPVWADHALALLLAVFFPIRSATFGYARLRRAAEEDVPRVRRMLYRQALVMQWSFVAAILALWLWQGRDLPALAVKWPSGPLAPWLVGLTALALLVLWVQAGALARRPGALEMVRRRLSHIGRMFPATPGELAWFRALAVTAGVCEELMFRGFLMGYCAHFVPWWAAALLSSVVFGIGHSYQGWRGMVQTGLVGFAMTIPVLLTGSLAIPVALHAAGDLYAGTLGHLAQRPAPGGAVEKLLES